MIPITIDISAAMSRLVPSESVMKSYAKYVLDSLGGRYLSLWEKEVDGSLRQTRGEYKRAMPEGLEYVDDFTAMVVLNGKGDSKLAVMIEKGASPFDIKEGFERSSKVKYNKEGGWYLTIPFRMATSEAIATSEIFSGQMPAVVNNIARTEGVTTEANLPVEFQVKGVRPEINRGGVTIPSYEHKASIYLGINHSPKQQHGQYTSFRRAGANSDDNSWIHRGFEPYNLMGKAIDKLVGEIPSIVANAEKEFFGQ